ncbi:MAG: NAD-dependent protein deacylase [Lachnospiraceae bacterium]|uniref:NAD-dependent protein deacylase n=1 Tax=Galactobacillus timonensis TaxID=2041840 RepID=UPI0023F280C4|nr:NAD-dependent protein deacylase [Galactobacillus timonensis]MDD7086674.1 NAD-dependent protein deacylase [Galactobacillus timonensis]MDY5221912.1 NAD-dependent protein deacylase [Lachnospiraceae bacterium]
MTQNLADKIASLQTIIDQAKHIVFFTGAGVSTDSGIPDFRSTNGLYNQTYRYPPEEIISHSFFEENPEEFFRFYKDRMLYLDAQPNEVHRFIAECEKKGKSLGVVTQNIDGLHQKAGSKHVYELHGSVLRNYCMDCSTFYSAEYIKNSEGVPRCQKCGGIIKPDVVLYEEGLSQAVVEGAVAAIQSADVMIVLGTSLVVYPAAGLIRYFSGRHLVLINRDATPYDSNADLLIQAPFADVFPHLHV